MMRRWKRFGSRVRQIVRAPHLYAAAAVVVTSAAWRVFRLERRLPLPDLVARLRAGRPLSGPARDPRILRQVAGTLVPLLPGRGAGLCYRRSLVLYHLWHRCGLRPRLHFGVWRSPADGVRGHAWVSEPALPPERQPVGAGAELVELATFP